jgi:hypothetical protein
MGFEDWNDDRLAASCGTDAQARRERDRWLLARFHSQYIQESQAADGVLLHFAANEGWIELYVKVAESTTIDDVRKGWDLVKKWRARIEAFQGPWKQGGAGGLYEDLSSRHGGRWSYARLATRLNDKIARDLVEYLADCKAYEAARAELKTYGDVTNWQFETAHYGFGWDRAWELLVVMGWTEGAAKQECRTILDQIRETGKPWIAEGPVTREQVIFQIKKWRKRTAGGVE